MILFTSSCLLATDEALWTVCLSGYLSLQPQEEFTLRALRAFCAVLWKMCLCLRVQIKPSKHQNG